MIRKNILVLWVLLLTPILLIAAPANPTNPQFYPLSSTSVSLNWTDSASDENGFKIFRDGKLIFITPANATHYTDTGLQPDTTYAYTVKSTSEKSYFVDPDGNDNDAGTQAHPWKTIEHAVNTLQAGETVWIKAGIYHEQLWVSRLGTADGHIGFRAFPHDTVILDGRAPTPQINGTWGGVFNVEANYIDIGGLTIQYSNFGAIWISKSQHIMIEDCNTSHSVSSGIYVEESSDITVNHNEVAYACSYGTEDNVAHECISIVDTNHSVISNNHVHDNDGGIDGGEGIDIKVGSHDITVIKNHIHHITNRIGLYVDAWNKETSGIQLLQNHIHHIDDVGISIASEQGGALSDVNITNNLIYNASSNGIEVGSANGGLGGLMSNMNIVNNTVYNNGHGSGSNDAHKGIVIKTGAIHIRIQNNIVSHNGNEQIVTDGSVTVTHNYVGNERSIFVDAAAYKFAITAGATAIIDQGSGLLAPSLDFVGDSRPQGLGYDIGAYER